METLEHRTKVNWTRQIEHLPLEFYPKAKKMWLTIDNLNTHMLGSLYEAFYAKNTHSLDRRLEIHYTPKHGWLV
ncbi:MAG: transposase [Nitrososphaerota archaeon]|nr:transposase [Nitrososphaerota archaeon]